MSVRYFDAGPIPILYAVSFTEADFRHEMKRLNVEEELPSVSPGSGGTTYSFVKDEVAELIVIMSIDGEHALTRKESVVFGLISHEAVHVMQMALEQMREKHAGQETEAYIAGWAAQCAFKEWERFKAKMAKQERKAK